MAPSEHSSEADKAMTRSVGRWLEPYRKKNRFVLALGPSLINSLNTEGCLKADDEATWNLEMQFGTACDQQRGVVGLDGDQPVFCDLLHAPELTKSERHGAIALGGMGAAARAKAHLKLDALDEILRWESRVARAYCGWLLTQRTFVSEHLDLLHRHWSMMQSQGLFSYVLPGEQAWNTALPPVLDKRLPTRRELAYVHAVRQFCDRWMLRSLASPFIPMPERLHLPIDATQTIGTRTRQLCETIAIPRTFILAGERDLRQWLSNVLDQSSKLGRHLSGWSKIAAGGRANKGREMDRLSRIFLFHEQWCVLQQRWHKQLERNRDRFRNAFATFFAISTKQMRKDFDLLRRSGALSWDHRRPRR